jgi:tetratricopeptide (TPR) repeat protein
VRKVGWAGAVVALLLVVSVPLSIKTYLSSVRLKTGTDLLRTGRYQEAEAQFARAAELSSHDYLPHYYLGWTRFQVGDFQGAIDASLTALDLNPNYVPTQVVLGATYLRLGEPQRAEGYLDKALEIAPERAEVLYYMAVCDSELGKWEQARDHFEGALWAGWEQRAELLSNLGVVYMKLDDMENAIQNVMTALKESSDDPVIDGRAGQFFYTIGEYEKAIAHLAKAVGLFQEKGVDPRANRLAQQAYYLLAKIHLEELGNPYFSSIAVLALSRAVPQEPALKEITEDLFAYLEQRKFSQMGDTAALYHVGASLLLQGRYQRAEEVLTILVKSGESNVSLLQLAYHDLALSIFMQKDFDRALRVLDEAGAIMADVPRAQNLREQILAGKEAAKQASPHE